MKQKLTFNDGLNFGCGFWVAGFMFFVIALPIGLFAFAAILLLFGRALQLAVGS